MSDVDIHLDTEIETVEGSPRIWLEYTTVRERPHFDSLIILHDEESDLIISLTVGGVIHLHSELGHIIESLREDAEIARQWSEEEE